MTQIHKFSLVYDVDEDRIAWDTETRDGDTSRLWLTQRLCRGLVNALLPLLVRKTARPEVPTQHEATLQSWEQAAAMADFGKVPGVKPTPQAATGLIRSVQIQPTEDGMVLALDFGEAEAPTIGLAFPEVRQMLTVIYRLYVAAGWPLDIWPAWISEPAPAAPATVVN
jgi:hypothetical protein